MKDNMNLHSMIILTRHCGGFWHNCLQKPGSEFYVYENKSVRKRGL